MSDHKIPRVVPTLDQVEALLEGWKRSLLPRLEIGGLFTRNRVAHKWKAPYRTLLLRETVFWRLHDLLTQSLVLHKLEHALGARILLRSGFETVALLIYCNDLMARVVSGDKNFHEFSEVTSRLVLGSRDESTKHKAINILTIIEKCAEKYAPYMTHYAALSESAHPNFEGLVVGYNRSDRENMAEDFANLWHEMYGANHLAGIAACAAIFEYEYNNEWPSRFANLERWITDNDEMLEATKST